MGWPWDGEGSIYRGPGRAIAVFVLVVVRDRASVNKREKPGFYQNYSWYPRLEKETRFAGHRSDRVTRPERETGFLP
ncbi:MAG: hypothetical protein EBE86_026995 [Hormoscilla sp. GUM202]|nr:hypothetical protein [Hormoscilla sp. GUM202]